MTKEWIRSVLRQGAGVDVCLTCDPGAMLAAYGSNWAGRKLTKCQWSVVPQEVINCEP